MKKITIILLISFLFICLILFLYIFFINNKSGIHKKNNTEYYSLEIARNAADDNMSVFESWRGATIAEIYTMYDLQNIPSAYLFTVKDYYGKAGYLVVSATNKNGPLIESSKLPDSPQTNLIKLIARVAEETRHVPADLKSQLIYLGMKDYLAKIEIREGSDLSVKYYKLDAGNPILLNEEDMKTRGNFYLSQMDETSDKNWEKYLK